MATADLRVLEAGKAEPTTGCCDALADRVFEVSAIAGAASGAWAGASASALAFPGANPALLGTLGVIVGSALAAVFGRYVVLPLWAGLFAGSKKS